MVVGGEASQLHLFRIFDLSGIRVTPFQRYLGISVCVNEHVKGAVPVQHRKKCDRSSDLSDDCLDLLLNFRLRFLLDSFRGAGERISFGA